MTQPSALPMQARCAHQKRRIDTRLGEIFAALRDPRERAVLHELLAITRQRSTLLTSHHLPRHGEPALDVLRNLASFAERFVRAPDEWPGCDGSPHEVVASLAEYLLCRYPVPRVLHDAWTGGQSPRERQRREWLIAHGAGQRLRRCGLPIALTRTMERHFVSSPHHLSFEQALRRAELLGLGAEPELVQHVLATRMGRDIDNAATWRSMSHFFVNNMAKIRMADVGPIVDFVHGIKLARSEHHYPDRIEVIEPPLPTFSIKGRTLASVLRLVDRWHESLGRGGSARQSWPGSPQRSIVFPQPERDDNDEEPTSWEIVELTNSAELQREGRQLQHCVAMYAGSCVHGRSRIWSLRRRHGKRCRSMATIEVHPPTGQIVQARAQRNRELPPSMRSFVVRWARREGLRLGVLAG